MTSKVSASKLSCKQIKCSFLRNLNPLFGKRTSFGVLLYDIISVPKDDIDFMA
jgi:hypothetical protein